MSTALLSHLFVIDISVDHMTCSDRVALELFVHMQQRANFFPVLGRCRIEMAKTRRILRGQNAARSRGSGV